MEGDIMLELITLILLVLLVGRGYTSSRLNKVSRQLDEISSHTDERLDEIKSCTFTLKQDVDTLSNRVEFIEETIQLRTPPPGEVKNDSER